MLDSSPSIPLVIITLFIELCIAFNTYIISYHHQQVKEKGVVSHAIFMTHNVFMLLIYKTKSAGKIYM